LQEYCFNFIRKIRDPPAFPKRSGGKLVSLSYMLTIHFY